MIDRAPTALLSALLIALVAIPVGASPASAQTAPTPFPCDGQFYGMQNARELYRINFATNPFTFTPIGSATSFSYNALGFNHVDGFLYGIINFDGPPRLARFGANGVVQDLGPVAGLPETEEYVAGAFNANGNYVVADGPGTALAVINVASNPPTVVSLSTYTTTATVSDFAVSPVDGRVYGFDSVSQRMVRINPTTGTLTAFGVAQGEPIAVMGSAWFDAFGRYFGYGREPSATVGQTTFYQADVGTGGPGQLGELVEVSTGPTASGSDGASCPFGVRMDKTVSPTSVQAGGVVTYTYTVTNRSDQVQQPTFADTMDGGRTFVPGTLSGVPGGTANAYGGTNTLQISGMTMAAGQTATVSVQVLVPASAPAGTVFNQARLSGLGGPVTASVRSDFPGAPGPEDRTPLQVTAAPVVTADLAVTKTGPAHVGPNDTLTYTLQVTNAGPSVATGVVLVDTLPAGFTPLSASSGGTFNGNVLTASLGTIRVGAAVAVTVDVRAPAQGAGTNVVEVTSTSPDPDTANNRAQVTTTVSASADLAVTKTGPAQVAPGSDVTYSIEVRNSGPSVAAAASATDNLPQGFAFLSASDGGVQTSPGVVTWGLGDMAPGTSLTRTVTVRAPVAGGGTNVVTVASSTPDPNSADNQSQVATSVSAAADVAVDKSGPAQVGASQHATYTITVVNNGPSPATDVTATDTLPAGFAVVSASDGGVQAGNTVVWALGTLAPGEPRTRTVTLQAPPEAGSATNTVTVASSTPETNPANNTDSVTTAVSPSADLAVAKSGPGEAGAGQSVTYTISVTNHGPSTAAGATATDTLPAGFTFVSASDGGTQTSPGVVTWALGDLPPGAGATRSVTVQAPTEGGTGTNVVSVASSTPDPDTANNQAQATTTVMASADLGVEKTGPPQVDAGQSITYTITVRNQGPSTAAGAMATDTLPAGFSFVSASDGGSQTSPRVVTWGLGDLPPGAVAVRTVTVQAPTEAASGTNVVTVASSTSDPNPGNNSAQAATTVVAVADVAVDKSGPAEVFAGDQATFTFTVTNAGPSTAADVVLAETVPAGFTVVSASDGGAQSSPEVVTWGLGSLAPGASVTRTVVLQAPNEAATVTDEATVSSSTVDRNPADNRDTVTTTVLAVTDMAVDKVGPAEVDAGQNVTYTLNVGNNGPSTAQGVAVSDALPAGFTFVSASDGGIQSSPGLVTWNLGTVGPSAVRTLTVVAQASGDGGTAVNRAHVDSSTFDPNGGNDDDSATTRVIPVADIAVDKSAPETVEAGENLTYSLVVTNAGPSTADNVVVTDRLPEGFVLVSVDSGGAETAPGVVTWNLGAMAAGTGRTVTVTATAPLRVFTATNQAEVRSDTLDRDTADNSDAVDTRVVDTTPPVTACAATTNPSGNNVPSAGNNPRSGQNPDGFYVLTAVDRVDPDPTVTLTDSASGQVFGPFPSGTKVKITQAPGGRPSQKEGPGEIDWHITINGDAQVRGTDFSGNVSTPVSCLVPPRPK